MEHCFLIQVQGDSIGLKLKFQKGPTFFLREGGQSQNYHYWWDWRSTSSHQPCSYLFFFFSWDNLQIPFSHSFHNRFWSTRYRMIDNPVLHHIMKNTLCFLYENSWILSKKTRGNTSLKRTNFGELRKKFLFFNDFQILHTGSNAIKELSKSFIFKNNLNFLKKLRYWFF